MPSLEAVTFDDTNFELQGDKNGTRVWFTPAGDGIGLFYFGQPPDIQADLNGVDALRAFYRNSTIANGLGLIEVDTFCADGYTVIRTVFKSPQQPSGMTYIGSLTLPFRDFSFVVKVQCAENGVTGTREAVIFDEILAAGKIRLDAGEGRNLGWTFDPYDPVAEAPLMRNLAEDEQYDSRFSEHPLSRLRAVLRQVEPSLRLATDVKNAPPFEFIMQQAKRPWWKKW